MLAKQGLLVVAGCCVMLVACCLLVHVPVGVQDVYPCPMLLLLNDHV